MLEKHALGLMSEVRKDRLASGESFRFSLLLAIESLVRHDVVMMYARSRGCIVLFFVNPTSFYIRPRGGCS